MYNPARDPLLDLIDDLRREASEVLLDPDLWLRTPNDQLGGQTPIDLVYKRGADGVEIVRDLLGAIKYGIPT
ncbi:MAG: MbcA/ParS/Xre antitoxin family protein [Blastocatellia bacterium]